MTEGKLKIATLTSRVFCEIFDFLPCHSVLPCTKIAPEQREVVGGQKQIIRSIGHISKLSPSSILFTIKCVVYDNLCIFIFSLYVSGTL